MVCWYHLLKWVDPIQQVRQPVIYYRDIPVLPAKQFNCSRISFTLHNVLTVSNIYLFIGDTKNTDFVNERKYEKLFKL